MKTKLASAKLVAILSLAFVLILFGGTSYAYLANNTVDPNEQKISTATCTGITFASGSNEVTVTGAVPQEHQKGYLSAKDYYFTVTNNCAQAIRVDLGIERLTDSTMAAKYIRAVAVEANESVDPVNESIKLTEGETGISKNGGVTYVINHYYIINSTGKKTFRMRVWVDQAADSAAMNKVFKGKIVATGNLVTATYHEDASPRGLYAAASTTLLGKLKTSTYVSTLDKATTLLGTAVPAGEATIGSAKDDFGTSWYFRGPVTNNFVSFAGRCWRIVRIQGDGSIKLVLYNNAGTACNATTINQVFTSTSTTYKWTTATNSGNASVGLMYGSPTAETYEATRNMTTKNNILTQLETYYSTLVTSLSTVANYLQDTIWCNDVSIPDKNMALPLYINDGILSHATNYAFGYKTQSSGTKEVSFKCSTMANDTYSKYTITSSKIEGGNKKLTNNIGLLTADEVVAAGAIINGGTTATYSYLKDYAGTIWWTLTPYKTISGNKYGSMVVVNTSGNTTYATTSSQYAIRPAIVLKPTVKVSSGSGTSTSPYVISSAS